MSGRLALLPHLTAEELDELAGALEARAASFASIRHNARSPKLIESLDHKAAIIRSLQTAVAEALIECHRPMLDDAHIPAAGFGMEER